MTEFSGENQNFAPAAPVHTPTPSAPTAPQSAAPAESERTFRQSEVNDLVGRAKSDAIERYKRDSSIASHNYQPQSQPGYAQQQSYSPQMTPQVPSHDDIRRIAAEESQRLRDDGIQQSRTQALEQEGNRIAQEFFHKINTGKAEMPDFDNVMANVDLRAIPYHVQLSNMVDNTAEVMYELAKNPSKIGNLQNLIDIDLRAGRQPNLALQEMKRLSQSIKDNKQAQNFKSPNDPLSQLRPGNHGTGASGALTTADYKRKYRV